MRLCTRIRTARRRATLSQAELANSLGVSRTAVANWESDKVRSCPSGERIAEIAVLAGVSWEWLATGRGPAAVSTEAVPAVDADFVDCPIERTLLAGFRAGNEPIRRALLTIAEAQLPSRGRP
ncbi:MULTISPECIES: helix-turn-helix transcriptional regulator [unclassified Luteimonas]